MKERRKISCHGCVHPLYLQERHDIVGSLFIGQLSLSSYSQNLSFACFSVINCAR